MNTQQQAKETNDELTAMWEGCLDAQQEAMKKYIAILNQSISIKSELREEYKALVRGRIDELKALLK